jgi:membrane-bound lytic murein transglycosylase D
MKYFHPFWETTNENPLPVRSEQLLSLMSDPQRRVEEVFSVSDPLQSHVLFWMRVYGQFSSWTKIIHDAKDPRIIYGYIDFAPLYIARVPRVKREIMKEWMEKMILRNLRDQLLQVSTNNQSAKIKRLRLYLTSYNLGSVSGTEYAKRLRSQVGQRDLFLLALQRSQRLMPSIEAVFKKRELPVGLSRLPFVESSFNDNAQSKVGAFGVWQFMPRTVKAYINEHERELARDPLLQAEVAAVLLKRNRSVLPDWGTAVTSYNVGVGRVQKLVNKYHVRKIDSLINAQRELGFAGLSYYPEFLAALYIDAYKEHVFPHSISTEPIEAFTTLIPMGAVGCKVK